MNHHNTPRTLADTKAQESRGRDRDQNGEMEIPACRPQVALVPRDTEAKGTQTTLVKDMYPSRYAALLGINNTRDMLRRK